MALGKFKKALTDFEAVKKVSFHQQNKENKYSGTSDKRPSEIGTTSLQRTLVAAPC